MATCSMKNNAQHIFFSLKTWNEEKNINFSYKQIRRQKITILNDNGLLF